MLYQNEPTELFPHRIQVAVIQIGTLSTFQNHTLFISTFTPRKPIHASWKRFPIHILYDSQRICQQTAQQGRSLFFIYFLFGSYKMGEECIILIPC